MRIDLLVASTLTTSDLTELSVKAMWLISERTLTIQLSPLPPQNESPNEVKCCGDAIWSQDLRDHDEEATIFYYLSPDCKLSLAFRTFKSLFRTQK